MQEANQEVQAGKPFQDITDSDVEAASPEEMLIDDSSDEELNHNGVDL